MNAPEDFWVRVLLTQSAAGSAIKVRSPFSVICEADSDEQARFKATAVPIDLAIAGGKISIGERCFKSKKLIILPDRPHIFNFDGDDYRGKLELVVDADGRGLTAINAVPLEPYLAGVVGAEMPHYWEPAALRAQAVAARTYCLYVKRRYGVNRDWDVKKTAANQVYKGLSAESASVWDAVDETAGEVLVCNQAEGGEDIFPAYYSSACGGHTEASSNVFGDSFDPLMGVECPFCRKVTKPTFFFWPMLEIDKETVTQNIFTKYPKLKELGTIKNIVPAKESDYKGFSRVVMVKLMGNADTNGFLRAEDLRLCLDPTGNKFRSTVFKVANLGDRFAFLSGRGYGHAVGMCQCGAQGLARRGRSYRKILTYYYPGSTIRHVY